MHSFITPITVFFFLFPQHLITTRTHTTTSTTTTTTRPPLAPHMITYPHNTTNITTTLYPHPHPASHQQYFLHLLHILLVLERDSRARHQLYDTSGELMTRV
ncbi:hypothetical protein E2C01_079235 [Portunus trituberculatus]|uniref:Secreted protein n=1 Tax=Portunus trituberculatus TaxID=210409 RepID=A0A5B7IS72_PORTR|nr:hypothetical protein [Portunus trituberculatus]